jgi:hypothetical protein
VAKKISEKATQASQDGDTDGRMNIQPTPVKGDGDTDGRMNIQPTSRINIQPTGFDYTSEVDRAIAKGWLKAEDRETALSRIMSDRAGYDELLDMTGANAEYDNGDTE